MRTTRFLYSLFISSMILLSSCEKDEPQVDVPEEQAIDESIEYVYTTDLSGKFEIWKHEDEQHTQLTENEDSDNWWPRMSPNRDKIIFYRSSRGRDINDYEDAELWIMDASGGEEKQLFSGSDLGYSQQGLANWSRGGDQIVYAAVENGSEHWQLFKCDIDGKHHEKLSPRDDVDYYDPIFAPDDNSIYCVTAPEGSTNDDANLEVYRIEIDSKIETRLTNNKHRDNHPDLSPGGKTLVYESLIDPNYLSIGKWVISELNMATSQERVLFDDDHINLFPRYVEGGEAIVYTHLDIETFIMSVAKYDTDKASTSSLTPPDRNSMNPDPF